MNRVLIAAGVAASHSHGDHWKSVHHPSAKRLLSVSAAAAAAVVARPEIEDGMRIRSKIAATDESLKQAMYMNCWGQS